MGKHNAVKNRGRIVQRASVTAAGIAVGMAVAVQPAHADPNQVDLIKQLIRCESGGNPKILNQSGSTASGMWQIVNGTWAANGGLKFAPTARQATVAQQNQVAISISRTQGADAWTCAPSGLRTPFSADDVARATGVGAIPVVPAAPKVAPAPHVKAAPVAPPVAPKHAPQAAPVPVASTAGNYVVVRGDTLSEIAERTGADWHKLYQVNRKVVGENPNLIFPGQSLDTQSVA